MRRILIRVAVAVVAFGIGIGVSWIWFSFRTLSYCEVARNSERYHNQSIRVEAMLIFGTGGMYVFEDCDPVEALASLVEMHYTRESGSRNYVEQVLLFGGSSKIKKVEAVIEGRFNGKILKWVLWTEVSHRGDQN